jgi:maltooligosyltrehalose trehalohydrolase
MIDLTEVGAFASLDASGNLQVRFGIYLPGITAANGYQVVVRVIHQADRFDPAIPTQDFQLTWQNGSALDLWTITTPLTAVANTNFGKPGVYLYRYQLWRTAPGGSPQLVTLWFTDPFATATDVGELSAFATPGTWPAFNWDDAAYKTPELDDLVVYELQVEEFNDTFDGVAAQIPYLQSLGVNVLELMPVTSVQLDFDWGYGPLHYFAPSQRLGGAAALQRLVNACHKAGMAVILDVVYQHVAAAFPYSQVYSDAGLPSPMIGGNGPFGPQADFTQTFTQDYFHAANQMWLNNFHVDGFRYDEVSDYYDGPTGTAYAMLAYRTYQDSLPIARFQGPNGYSRIIQCAEALSNGRVVLANTYTNAVWQDDLLNTSENMAKNRYTDANFAHLLDPNFMGYPASKTVNDSGNNPVPMPVAPFQYLESHDHSQLISFVGTTQDDSSDVPFGDRSQFYKLQPFAIALYTCQGVPMLWQGQEFADNWTLPPSGRRRISFERNTHWEYFYDASGSTLIHLYRSLGNLRRTYRSLRSRQSYYYYQQSSPGNQILVYHRLAPATATQAQEISVVFLNFSDNAQSIAIPFPSAGVYREMINDADRQKAGQPSWDLNVATDGQMTTVQVPSNYGCVFVSQ